MKADTPGTDERGPVADPAKPVGVDTDILLGALAVANIPTLLMVLHHLTGDDRWLREPYAPTRARGLDDHDTGGLSDEAQAEVHAAAAAAVREWSDGREPAVPHPDLALLARMLTVCMGEPVPEEYARMMLVEMGFERTPTQAQPSSIDPGDHDVLIVGAGVSGLVLGVRLDEAGIPYRIIEKNDDVGGTWLENRYPGAGVDTPSYLYSLSFHPRNWSTYFGKRDEVLEYLRDVADTFDLRRRIHFGAEVERAWYDEGSRRWNAVLRSRDGRTETTTARYLVTAVGLLSRPKLPAIEGLDRFQGPIFHSAEWPDGLDVSGKRVAVVGSGASAMQIVPAIAGTAAHVAVFQRSPQWAAPSGNYFAPVGPKAHWLMAHVPYYHRWYRARLAWTFNDRVWPSLQIDPDWEHPDRSLNRVNDAHRKLFTRYLKAELEGRDDLVEKCLPTYPPYGKRILLDNGWYAALRRPDVELVTEAVAAVTPTGVRTVSGIEHEADVVVLCTGFEAQRLLHPIDVRGRSGRSIREAWGEDDPRAYLGIATVDFPNLLFMYGPNTNPGGGSYMFIAECQAHYVVDLLGKAMAAGAVAIECRRDVHDRFNREVDAQHAKMVWSHSGMQTYYRNASGRVVTNWPWRVVDYWDRTRSADLRDYVLEREEAEAAS